MPRRRMSQRPGRLRPRRQRLRRRRDPELIAGLSLRPHDTDPQALMGCSQRRSVECHVCAGIVMEASAAGT